MVFLIFLISTKHLPLMLSNTGQYWLKIINAKIYRERPIHCSSIYLKSPLNFRFILTIHSAITQLSMNHHSSGVRLIQFCLDIVVSTIARL